MKGLIGKHEIAALIGVIGSALLVLSFGFDFIGVAMVMAPIFMGLGTAGLILNIEDKKRAGREAKAKRNRSKVFETWLESGTIK